MLVSRGDPKAQRFAKSQLQGGSNRGRLFLLLSERALGAEGHQIEYGGTSPEGRGPRPAVSSAVLSGLRKWPKVAPMGGTAPSPAALYRFGFLRSFVEVSSR